MKLLTGDMDNGENVKPFIDPEIMRSGEDLMVAMRKELDKILLEGGMAQEEIQTLVEDAMDNISINGVPIHSKLCTYCEGRGWVKS